MSEPRFILHGLNRQDEWACAYPSAMMFIYPHDGQQPDGKGLYGPNQYLVYEWGDNHLPGALSWRLKVWRDSEGIHVARCSDDD